MTEREVKKWLKNCPAEQAEPEQVERCLRRLPDVKKRGGFFSVFRLQASYIPGWAYFLLSALLLLAAGAGCRADTRILLPVAEVFFLCFDAFMLGFVILSDNRGMRELENSCRYNYAYILAARILLTAGGAGVIMAWLNLFVFARFRGFRLFLNMAFLFPACAGLAVMMAAAYVFRIRRTGYMLGIYMTAAILSDMAFYHLRGIMLEKPLILSVSLLVCLAAVAVIGKNMMERKFVYEAYDM